MGNLGLVVPIAIDNKRVKTPFYLLNHKVTKINAEVHFDVQLSDSSPEKTLGAKIVDTTHKLTKKPYIRLYSTFKLMRVGGLAHEKLEYALEQTVNYLQTDVDNFLHTDNILNQFNKILPEGVSVEPGAINIRSRVDDSNNLVFDTDCNADIECKISADALKGVFKGYEIGGCRFEKISNIKMEEGKVELTIPLSGTVNGSIVSSFDLSYCKEQQCFSFSNLSVKPQDSASSLLSLSCGTVNCFQNFLSGHLEDYINKNLENMRLLAINNAQQQYQQEFPGSLSIDCDSLAIKNINIDNTITLNASLRSNM